MRRICCLPGSEPAPQVWVFLAPSRFATKILILGYWISLDSLVRIEAFQWFTRDKSVIFFLRALSPLHWHLRAGDRGLDMQKGEVGHTASSLISVLPQK